MQRARDAEVEIIRLLKAARDAGNAYVPGTRLCASSGVSRTAVWKHVETLRRSGYSIEAAASKGYRLSPDSPLPFNGVEISSALETSLIGSSLHFHKDLASTNTTAFELARAGAEEGTVVVADSQSNGRGRLGRRWESPAGVNLYTSVILRPRISPLEAHRLTFVSAVAAAEAVEGLVPSDVSVKWPNDILIGSKKVAGILLEMDSEAERVRFVIAGMGMNVNMDSTSLPAELAGSATSIMEASGVATCRAEVARRLYSSIEKWYKIYTETGFEPVMGAWKARFTFEGKPVRVESFERVIEGICAGLGPDGALLVRTRSGAMERVVSGDVAQAGA